MNNRERYFDLNISELGTTTEFCLKCASMNIFKLGDIIIYNPDEIIRMPGFSYHWLAELIAILEKNKILHLLQSVPEKNHD